jgi:hypothetical protein
MSRVAWFLNGPGGAFVIAAVVFVVALAGHAGLGLALMMSGIMVAYGFVLLIGRRWDPISVLAAPGRDERAFNLHLRAAAAAGQVLAVVIVGGFLYDLARGALDHSQWPALGAVFGVVYLISLVVFTRRA